MFKFLTKLRFFFVYWKNLKQSKKFLQEKYGFLFNIFQEFYITITLEDAPDELKQKYGSALAKHEIDKFITKINNDLPKLELNELVKVYEIKKLDEFNYGVAFGYREIYSRKIIYSLLFILLSLISILTLITIK